jgi:Ca-activated chloride channel family protein
MGEEGTVIGFDLLRPQYLWVPLLFALVLVVGAVGLRRRRADLRRLVGARQLARFAPHASSARPALRLALACAGLLLAGFSLLGPVRGYTTRATVRRGLDIVLCIDTSRSMLAQDLQPDRLERAKREVRGLVDRLRGDRCALIAFSGDSREVAPLTHDRATLNALLDQISPDDNQRGGTDLAAAMQHALDLFDGRTGAHEAICLLTDGEDLEGRAAELAETAQERGIRVFVVGVGTEAGGKIPVVGADGRQGFLRGPDGEEVVTRLAGTSLQAIAEATGGAYLSVEMSPTPLEELYEARIATLEGREHETADRRVPHDRFQWSLALAVLCMLSEAGLRERRAREVPA